MNRVTWAEVSALLEETSLTDTIGNVMISSAHTLISSTYTDTSELSEDELKQLELWLSAHFASIRDRRTSVSRIGDESYTWEGQSGMGLNATGYGQQVLLFDRLGRLADALSQAPDAKWYVSLPVV